MPTTAAADAPPKLGATDFVRDGVGFVQKHCLSCHGEKVQKADLSLHTYRDEASILKGRKVLEGVVKMVQSGEMPPAGRPRPTAAEVEAFLKSVQGVFVRHSKPEPGRVTIRRLNRTEYTPRGQI